MKTAKILMFVFLSLWTAQTAYAILGCTLNDPDRDVKRLFPESTGYTTTFLTIEEKGGEALKKDIERDLGDTFEPVYESLDVPYAFYTVFQGKETLGYVHGVNQKGQYGGMQLMVSSGIDGRIRVFWYHKLSSPEAAAFQDTHFTDKFNGLTLADFLRGGLPITDPSKNSSYDFQATMRGLKKNRILLKKLLLEDGKPSK